MVLALFSIIAGYGLNVREMLEATPKETQNYIKVDAFATAWPTHAPGHGADDGAGAHAAAQPETTTPAGAHAHGEHIMRTWVFWAFIVGMGLGFLIYMNGYAIADVGMRFLPVRMIHTWLYRRMYFDELYFSVFVAITMGLSRLSAWFDAYVVDGIVNLVGWLTKQLSFAIGLHDKYVIDGAVDGMATLAHEAGAAVRAPQSGRIRMYVTVLMIAVTLGVAGTIIVLLSR
jgi:hypothetical protein